MGFFSKSSDMARETPSNAAESMPSSSGGDAEPARPGTSGTELLLVNNRRRASTRYKAAAKKERDYKTKKRATSARANYAEAVCYKALSSLTFDLSSTCLSTNHSTDNHARCHLVSLPMTVALTTTTRNPISKKASAITSRVPSSPGACSPALLT